MARTEIIQQIADMKGASEPGEPRSDEGPPKPWLHAQTLYWASCYVQETAEAHVPHALRGEGFANWEAVATLLGAAAHRVERGDVPAPPSEDHNARKGPGSPPGLASTGVLPVVANAMIAQLRCFTEGATPGVWELESSDGVDIRWMAVPGPIQSSLLTPEEKALKTLPIGTTSFSPRDEVYTLCCVNAVPVLVAEIERLRKLVK